MSGTYFTVPFFKIPVFCLVYMSCNYTVLVLILLCMIIISIGILVFLYFIYFLKKRLACLVSSLPLLASVDRCLARTVGALLAVPAGASGWRSRSWLLGWIRMAGSVFACNTFVGLCDNCYCSVQWLIC